MIASEILSYVGATTGVIGTCTGVFGAVMGVIAYRRAGALKSIDLRLELRRLDVDLQRVIEGLPHLLEKAKKSREAINAAKGMFKSGAMQGWQQHWEQDLAAVQDLPQRLPCVDFNFDKATHKSLEHKLIEVHKLRGLADRFANKYEASLAADDGDRDHLRADVRSRTGPAR